MIWLADTNYRIDLENEIVRSLATTDQLDALLAADQVRITITRDFCPNIPSSCLISSTPVKTGHGLPDSIPWL